MRYGDVRIVDVFRLLDQAAAMVNNQPIVEEGPLCPLVFGNDNLGQVGALYQVLGSEIIAALRRSDVQLVLDDGTHKVLVQYREKPRVDMHARFLFTGIDAPVGRPNWDYRFDPNFEPGYEEVVARIKEAFKLKDFISAAQVQELAEKKKEEILKDSRYANLFLGAQARPFIVALPPQNIGQGELGRILTDVYVPAAQRGYSRCFPDGEFNDQMKKSLVGQVDSFPGSRQERLIEALAKGPVVLWAFANCLQGGSIDAGRLLIQKQDEQVMLNGTIVNSAIVAAYSALVASSRHNPLLFCAADMFQSGKSLLFGPNDGRLDFVHTTNLSSRNGEHSAGVSILA